MLLALRSLYEPSSANVTATLSATEAGGDTATLSATVSISAALGATEAASKDQAAFAGGVYVGATFAATELNQDSFAGSVSFSANVGASLNATEAERDVFVGSTLVDVGATFTGIEAGEDDYNGALVAAGPDVSATLAATETGQDSYASLSEAAADGSAFIGRKRRVRTALARRTKLPPVLATLQATERGSDTAQFRASVALPAVVLRINGQEAGRDTAAFYIECHDEDDELPEIMLLIAMALDGGSSINA